MCATTSSPGYASHQIKAFHSPQIYLEGQESCTLSPNGQIHNTQNKLLQPSSPGSSFIPLLFHLAGTTGDWPVPSVIQRSKLILPERQGPAMLKAVAASGQLIILLSWKGPLRPWASKRLFQTAGCSLVRAVPTGTQQQLQYQEATDVDVKWLW